VERPTGITLIVIYYVVLAVLSLLWSGLIFGVGGLSAFFGGLFGAENMATFGTASGWTGFFGIIAAVVQFVVAFGLYVMKKWAWVLALIGVALTVVEGIIGLFSGGPFAFMCGSLALVIPVIILIYLLRDSTRRIFD
jgi:hypothetical protein